MKYTKPSGLFCGIKPTVLLFFLLKISVVQFARASDTLEIINIESSIIDQTYQLYTRTPPGYSSKKEYPVIILLEANYYHRTFANLYDSIYEAGYDNHIIVGIGYLPNPFADTAFIRDFTPSKVKGFPNSGQASRFKEILEQELIPAILDNYNTDPARLSIVGHHYSALFLCWLLTQEAPKYANYIICSPALNYDYAFTDFKIDSSATSGIYFSSGSGKIIYIKDLEATKSKVRLLAKALSNKIAVPNNLQISTFNSTLRYDDLYNGFSEGIEFLFKNSKNQGILEKNLAANRDLVTNKSLVIVDKITDSNTSNQYEIMYYMPDDVTTSKLPLVVILDGDFNFTELLTAAHAEMLAGDIPQSMIVGIGYGTTIIDRGNYRSRDFLPNELKRIESGNASHFADLVNKQLIDHLSEYLIDINQMTLAGHSYGGLFLAYLLTRDDIVYTNFVISSPALWQDRAVLKALKNLDPEINHNIFIASGTINDNDKDAKKLGKVMRGKVRKKQKTVIYPNDDHKSVTSKALVDGLKFFAE